MGCAFVFNRSIAVLGKEKIVALLLQNGTAAMDLVDNKGRSALHMAAKNGI